MIYTVVTTFPPEEQAEDIREIVVEHLGNDIEITGVRVEKVWMAKNNPDNLCATRTRYHSDRAWISYYEWSKK